MLVVVQWLAGRLEQAERRSKQTEWGMESWGSSSERFEADLGGNNAPIKWKWEDWWMRLLNQLQMSVWSNSWRQESLIGWQLAALSEACTDTFKSNSPRSCLRMSIMAWVCLFASSAAHCLSFLIIFIFSNASTLCSTGFRRVRPFSCAGTSSTTNSNTDSKTECHFAGQLHALLFANHGHGSFL